MASALDAAYAAGLIHRDVKPANMLVDTRPDRADHVYLSDFGLCKGALSSIGLTGVGQVVGTPGFSAPEQLEGRAVDGRTDQYALACTAFKLLTGEAPFQRDQWMAVVRCTDLATWLMFCLTACPDRLRTPTTPGWRCRSALGPALAEFSIRACRWLLATPFRVSPDGSRND